MPALAAGAYFGLGRPMFRSLGSLVQDAHISEAYVGRGSGTDTIVGCTLDTKGTRTPSELNQTLVCANHNPEALQLCRHLSQNDIGITSSVCLHAKGSSACVIRNARTLRTSWLEGIHHTACCPHSASSVSMLQSKSCTQLAWQSKALTGDSPAHHLRLRPWSICMS